MRIRNHTYSVTGFVSDVAGPLFLVAQPVANGTSVPYTMQRLSANDYRLTFPSYIQVLSLTAVPQSGVANAIHQVNLIAGSPNQVDVFGLNPSTAAALGAPFFFTATLRDSR